METTKVFSHYAGLKIEAALEDGIWKPFVSLDEGMIQTGSFGNAYWQANMFCKMLTVGFTVKECQDIIPKGESAVKFALSKAGK